MLSIPSSFGLPINAAVLSLGQVQKWLSAAVLAAAAAAGPAIAGGHGTTAKIGEFVYFADAALFVDCMSGESVPVAQEGEFLAVQRAYTEARSAPQAALVVVVEGAIAEREGMEGGMRPMLVVERLAGVVPGLRCERAKADSPLENTYWKLLTLGGEPIAAPVGTREARMQFGLEDGRFSSTVGCNMINGGFGGTMPNISLSSGAMTMMACEPPLDAQEQAFVAALDSVALARITGPTLELLDADGNGLAFFEDVALP